MAKLKSVGSILFVSAVGVVFSLPTLLNGFPIVYNDSGYYVLHAIYDSPSWAFLWRPLTYSMFIGPFVEAFGLTGAIVFNNLIFSAMIFWISKKLLYLDSFVSLVLLS